MLFAGQLVKPFSDLLRQIHSANTGLTAFDFKFLYTAVAKQLLL